MNDSLSEGDTLEVMPPNGVFCLRDRQTPLVLFGGGSGVTPVISILKTALETTSRPVKLIYANRDDKSIIFKEELSKLHAANADRLEVVHRLDDLHGYVDAALIVPGGIDAAREELRRALSDHYEEGIAALDDPDLIDQ